MLPSTTNTIAVTHHDSVNNIKGQRGAMGVPVREEANSWYFYFVLSKHFGTAQILTKQSLTKEFTL